MKRRAKVGLIAVVSLAISVTVGLTAFGGTASAKKKSVKSVTVTASTPIAIPTAAGGAGPWGRLDVPFVVGKQAKGKVVGVDAPSVTYQTAGSIPGAAGDLEFELLAPNGRKQNLLSFIGDQNIGPLTVNANSPVDLCDDPTPPCSDPDESLNRPFAGTAGQEDLGFFSGLNAKGTWLLRITDSSTAGTNTLLLAKLVVPLSKKPK